MRFSDFLVILVIVQVQSESCSTPNQERAQCISLYTCTVLLKALVSQKKEAVDFVRQSHCGTWSNDTHPLVCCGTKSDFDKNEPIVTAPTPATKSSSGSPISDLRFCGYQHTDDYFYSGNITAIDEFPWLAVFVYVRDSDLDEDLDDDFVKFGCAGSLITPDYVLTAAQCLRLRTSKIASVRLGEYNLKHEVDCVKFSEIDDCSSPIEDVAVAKRIKHPNYNRRLGLHDIALLKLNRSITYTDYIRPICLPGPRTKFAQFGDIMTMSGFGRTGTNDQYAIIKKKTLTKLISNIQCVKEFSIIKDKTRNVTDNIICTKDVSASQVSCEGDSGGPLMFSHRTQWHIEGVAVWSSDICVNFYPFAYTRVANYLDWIENTIRNN